jgi:ubiquinone/menaquinone biosynthesis C-methylase UbiE
MMDQFLPSIIRDNKYFMYPFFMFAYRGKNIKEAMEFKSRVYSFTEQEYSDFYNSLNSISRNRLTDLNTPCINYILNSIDKTSESLIDIGCANGFMLKKIHEKRPHLSLSGFDIKNFNLPDYISFTQGYIHKLPFKDKEFDSVICNHTLEHLLDLKTCVNELQRIARKEIIIVTPCQKPFYYTLDEHVNFFFYKETLTSLFSFKNFSCFKMAGDWVYHGFVED